MEDYIALKLCSNLGFGFSNLKVYLKNSCNEVVFEGVTDGFGFVKLPICDGKVYKLVIYSNVSILKIPLIAKKNKVYCINIINNIANNRKYLVTFMLIDKYNPNIKIEGGKMILWQDTQFQ